MLLTNKSNNQGLITGTQFILGPQRADRAFLLNPRSGDFTQLTPLSPDALSWGMDINNRGDVLGYSFGRFDVFARIGVWSNYGQFETYFDESTVGFVSNLLRFNDNNLIVISAIDPPYQVNNGKAYLVPKPGVLLNLADLLVDNKGLFQSFSSVTIIDVNNHGDMIGFGCCAGNVFLLERVGHGND